MKLSLSYLQLKSLLSSRNLLNSLLWDVSPCWIKSGMASILPNLLLILWRVNTFETDDTASLSASFISFLRYLMASFSFFKSAACPCWNNSRNPFTLLIFSWSSYLPATFVNWSWFKTISLDLYFYSSSVIILRAFYKFLTFLLSSLSNGWASESADGTTTAWDAPFLF